MSQVIGIIPARYDSTRLPGKLLLDLDGKSVLERTWQQSQKSNLIDKVVIAAADKKIQRAAEDFGAEVIPVYEPYQSGSDRVAAALEKIPDDAVPEIVVNIQGDEPQLNPLTLDAVISVLLNNSNLDVATAVTHFQSKEDFKNSSCVKVIRNWKGLALYFSRSSIPYDWENENNIALLHIGIYAFRTQVLREFAKLTPCALERTEKLEQLRLLWYGYNIGTALVEEKTIGVDTEEDFQRVNGLLKGS